MNAPDLEIPTPAAVVLPRSAVIVGRPNVGKSALFNRLAGHAIAIVHDQPGITRDRLGAECRLGDSPFEVTDTGGIGADVDVGFTERVRAEADIAIATAGVILFVVDGQSGVLPLDLEVTRLLRRSGKDVLLVVNKIDRPDLPAHEARLADFASLGFPEVYGVSAAHGHGFRPLVAAIERRLPRPATVISDFKSQISKKPPHLALVGRPNVGKSSLTNAILGEARTIVSPVSGTTRDAVDVPATVRGERYVLIDTAGLRHRGKRDNSAEVFSAMRSERSIRRADLCVLVIDASAGVTAQDRQIAGMIQKAGKPCVVAVNKWDLVAETEADTPQAQRALRTKWLENAHAELFFLPHTPLITVSALHNEQIGRVFAEVEKVRRGASARLGTGPLNRVFRDAMEHQPPPLKSNRRWKMLYATQVEPSEPSAIPPPAFLLFVNDPALLTDPYRRYLETRLREVEPYPGLPIFFKQRGREPKS